MDKEYLTFPANRIRTRARIGVNKKTLTLNKTTIDKKRELEELYEKYNSNINELNKILNNKERGIKEAEKKIEDILDAKNDAFKLILGNAQAVLDPTKSDDIDKNTVAFLEKTGKILRDNMSVGPVERRKRSKEDIGYFNWIIGNNFNGIEMGLGAVALLYTISSMDKNTIKQFKEKLGCNLKDSMDYVTKNILEKSLKYLETKILS